MKHMYLSLFLFIGSFLLPELISPLLAADVSASPDIAVAPVIPVPDLPKPKDLAPAVHLDTPAAPDDVVIEPIPVVDEKEEAAKVNAAIATAKKESADIQNKAIDIEHDTGTQ